MRLTVMGSGYVGLVAGACFADTGHDVVCFDPDVRRIAALRAGEVPIHEEGLAEVVGRGLREERLVFTDDPRQALAGAEINFLAVGTPRGATGEADLKSVFAGAKDVARHAKGSPLLVLMSTVPVGTNARVTGLLRELGKRDIEVASNPEFLRAGTALDDFRRPDRVVLGVRSAGAGRVLRELYDPFCRTGAPILEMDPASAELTKYAANALLATRLSVMNAVANLCERVGADVEQVRHGVGSDRRIGPAFLFPGVGYGGSCVPGDVRALVTTARAHGLRMGILEEVARTNDAQQSILVTRIEKAFAPLGGLAGRTIALWGLAFKANTDDLRESPSVTILEGLIERGARIRAHDPVAMPRARDALAALVTSGGLTFANSMYEAASRADALAIATDWSEYRRPDFKRLRTALARPWVFDGRNLWDARTMAGLGIAYRSIGRPDLAPGPVDAG